MKSKPQNISEKQVVEAWQRLLQTRTELVTGDSGRVVPYGGNPWKLDKPDVAALAQAAAEILQDQGRFRKAARLRAEEAFGLDTMVDRYLEVLLG